MLNWFTNRYPSDAIHNADSGDLKRLELETLDFIVYWGSLSVEGLGDQPNIIDPCVPVNQLSIDSVKPGNLHIRPTPLT